MKNLLDLNGAKALNRAEQKQIFGGDPIAGGPGGGSGSNGGGGGIIYWPTNEEDCLLCGGEWEMICALPDDSVCL